MCFILGLILITSVKLHVIKVRVGRKIVTEESSFGFERNIFIRKKSSQAPRSNVHKHLYNDQVIILHIIVS